MTWREARLFSPLEGISLIPVTDDADEAQNLLSPLVGLALAPLHSHRHFIGTLDSGEVKPCTSERDLALRVSYII